MHRFLKFCADRELIRVKREELKLPAPWTDDPIFLKHRFANVRREDDAGTRYLRELQQKWLEPVKLTLLYRLINRESTWREIGCVDIDRILDGLDELQLRGPIFTRCWNPKGLSVKKLREHVPTWDTTSIIEAAKTGSAEAVWAEVVKLKPIGKFVAWQCTLDLGYLFPLKGDWAYLGPGAVKALKLLNLPATLESLKTVALAMKDTLATAEHALCEWQKYVQSSAMRNFEERPVASKLFTY